MFFGVLQIILMDFGEGLPWKGMTLKEGHQVCHDEKKEG